MFEHCADEERESEALRDGILGFIDTLGAQDLEQLGKSKDAKRSLSIRGPWASVIAAMAAGP